MSDRNSILRESSIQIRLSSSESQATGLSVGRITLPNDWTEDAHALAQAIHGSGCAVVILRMDARHTSLPTELEEFELKCHLADTLLYFESNERPAAPQWSSPLRQVDQSGEDELKTLIRNVFSEYTNHYTHSPIFKGIDTANAYADWAARSLRDPKSQVKILESSGKIASVAITQESAGREVILLAGTAPEMRNSGFYDLLIQLLLSDRGLGLSATRISTQVANTHVMRVWCKYGFRPVYAESTVHVWQASLDVRSQTAPRSAAANVGSVLQADSPA